MKRFFSAMAILLLFASFAYAGETVTASITAQNTFTAALRIQQHGTVRISGTFTATVSLQRSEDDGQTWVDTGDTWTAGGVFPFTDYTNRKYRVGVKTGNFTTGTVSIELGSAS